MYPGAVRQFPINSNTLNLATLPSRIRHRFLSGAVLSQGGTQFS